MRLIPASASAFVNEATRPTTEKSNGPSSSSQGQPAAATMAWATDSCGQTIDTSSAVRVIETNSPDAAQAGTASRGPRRHTASVPGSSVKVSGRPSRRTGSEDEQGREDQRDRRQELDQ